jgi:hypothetical protein
MKKIFLSIPAFVIIILSGCITSLHPLVTYDTAVSEDRIVGNWKGDDQDYTVQKLLASDFYKKNKKQIEEDSKNQSTKKTKRDALLFSKYYIVRYIKDGVKYELGGAMIKIGGQLFINFNGADLNFINGNTEPNLPNRLESNTIARLKFINTNTIKLDFIDGGYVYDQIKAGRMKIKNERDDLYDTFLITASTNELQQFIEKYGNDDRFFNKENSVTLIRKS